MREDKDQKNSEYRHFSRSISFEIFQLSVITFVNEAPLLFSKLHNCPLIVAADSKEFLKLKQNYVNERTKCSV